MSHKCHVPISELPSAATVALGAVANTVTSLAIPGSAKDGSRPSGFRLQFYNGATAVRGRMALAASNVRNTTVITDTDTTLGHVFTGFDDPVGIPHAAKFVDLACNTASASALITWLYERG